MPNDPGTPILQTQRFQLRILFLTGRANPKVFLLNSEQGTLGSAEANDIRFNDPTIAEAAAVIQQVGGRFSIKNTGPARSLLVGGKSEEEAELQEGTEIQLGSFQMKVQLTPAPPLAREMQGANVPVTVDATGIKPPERRPPPRLPAKRNYTPLLVILGAVGIVAYFALKPEPLSVGELENLDEGGKTRTVKVLGPHSRRASAHDSIFVGDIVQTASDQSATVQLKDGSVVIAAPSSELEVMEVDPTPTNPSAEIKLNSGLVYVDVAHRITAERNRFRVRTRNMTMGVRGTEFVTEVTSNGPATVHTLEGVVATAKSSEELASASGGQLVKENEMASASEGSIEPSKKFEVDEFFTELSRRSPSFSSQVNQRHQRRPNPEADTSHCADFTGYVSHGEDKADPTGGIPETKEREMLVNQVIDKLRLDMESDLFAFYSSAAGKPLFNQIFRLLRIQDPRCSDSADPSPQCITLTSARSVQLILAEFGSKLGQTHSEQRSELEIAAQARILQDPKIRQIATDRTNDVLRDSGFTAESEALTTKVVPAIKNTLISVLKSHPLNPSEIEWATAKVNSISLDFAICHRTKDLLPRLLNGEAEYHSESNSIQFCPSHLVANTSQFHLVFKLARLFARAVGPCYLKLPFQTAQPIPAGLIAPPESALANSVGACFRSNGSIWAALMNQRIISAKLSPSEAETPQSCVESNIYDSLFADWTAATVLAAWSLKEKSDLKPAELRLGYRNVWRGTQPIQSANEAVLATLYRVDGIFATEPSIRTQLGCKTPHPKFKTCN